MKLNEIRSSLETNLYEAIQEYNSDVGASLPIEYENTRLDTSGLETWVRATLLPNNITLVGVTKESPALYRGFFQVDVFTLKEIGTKLGYDVLNVVSTYFVKGLTLNNFNVKVEIQQLSILQGIDEENYFRVSARIPWFSYIFN